MIVRNIAVFAVWATAACTPAREARMPRPSESESPTSTTLTPLDVAITVDDLPVHGPAWPAIDRLAIADRILATFHKHHLPPVYGFVNGKLLADNPRSRAILDHWIAGGNPLGNHTYSHVSLNDVTLPEYLADLEKGEEVLRSLEADASAWKLFRYPFLFEGDTREKREGVRNYLRDRGYAIAEVTIDADDWAFNPPFARCSERRDAAALASLHRTFVDVHVDELRVARDLTRALAHRDVRHVLLLHIGAADADAMDDLLSAYEREGVRWVGLRDALADPFYAEDPALPVPSGAAFPYLLARARGVSAPKPSFARGVHAELDRVCR